MLAEGERTARAAPEEVPSRLGDGSASDGKTDKPAELAREVS